MPNSSISPISASTAEELRSDQIAATTDGRGDPAPGPSLAKGTATLGLAGSILSVRRLMFGALTLVTVIPLIVFWFWPFSRAIDDDMGFAARAHLLIARNLGAALDRYYTDVRTTFDLLSANIETGGHLHDVEPLLLRMHFRHVCLAEAETGRVLNSFIRNDLTCPEVIPSARLALFREMATEGVSRLSPVLAGPGGTPVIYIVRRSENMLTVGALQTTYFRQLASQIAFGEQGHAAIVDQDGRVLAHPDSAWMQERRDLSGLPIVDRMIAGETGVATFFSPAFQEEMIAGFTAAELSGWGVMVPQPVAELESEVGSIRRSGLSVLALGIAVALVVAWVLSGLLARPIRQVLALTKSIDGPTPSLRLPPLAWYTPMELRRLATSFNEMLARIGNAAEKVIQAQLRAEHHNLAKSEFLANVSHEFRTPLNAILGFSESLAQGALGSFPEEKRQEYIQCIHSGALHLKELIQDIVDVSSIEAGAVEPHHAEFLLETAVKGSVKLVSAQAVERQLKIETDLPEQPVVLLGDARQFSQVLINLLTNAIKFTKGRSCTVRLTATFEPSGDLTIKVVDKGIGIAPDQMSSVLQPFKRGEDSYVRGQPGSGLGLSIVSAILERHEGALSLESTEGTGTTAIIRWPRRRILPAAENRSFAAATSA